MEVIIWEAVQRRGAHTCAETPPARPPRDYTHICRKSQSSGKLSDGLPLAIHKGTVLTGCGGIYLIMSWCVCAAGSDFSGIHSSNLLLLLYHIIEVSRCMLGGERRCCPFSGGCILNMKMWKFRVFPWIWPGSIYSPIKLYIYYNLILMFQEHETASSGHDMKYERERSIQFTVRYVWGVCTTK